MFTDNIKMIQILNRLKLRL